MQLGPVGLPTHPYSRITQQFISSTEFNGSWEKIFTVEVHLVKCDVGILHDSQTGFITNFLCGDTWFIHPYKEPFHFPVGGVFRPDEREICEGSRAYPPFCSMEHPAPGGRCRSRCRSARNIRPVFRFGHGKTSDSFETSQFW